MCVTAYKKVIKTTVEYEKGYDFMQWTRSAGQDSVGCLFSFLKPGNLSKQWQDGDMCQHEQDKKEGKDALHCAHSAPTNLPVAHFPFGSQ